MSLSELIGITFFRIIWRISPAQKESTQENRSDHCAHLPDIAESIWPDNSESISPLRHRRLGSAHRSNTLPAFAPADFLSATASAVQLSLVLYIREGAAEKFRSGSLFSVDKW
jgi:hypothetical protein